MHQITRAKVARNADYHQQLADYYTSQTEGAQREANGEQGEEPIGRPQAESAALAESTSAESDPNQYLADLHNDVAQQLRDILGSGEPPAIVTTPPPIVRETNPPTGYPANHLSAQRVTTKRVPTQRVQ